MTPADIVTTNRSRKLVDIFLVGSLNLCTSASTLFLGTILSSMRNDEKATGNAANGVDHKSFQSGRRSRTDNITAAMGKSDRSVSESVLVSLCCCLWYKTEIMTTNEPAIKVISEYLKNSRRITAHQGEIALLTNDSCKGATYSSERNVSSRFTASTKVEDPLNKNHPTKAAIENNAKPIRRA
jgi:hypothetical protein